LEEEVSREEMGAERGSALGGALRLVTLRAMAFVAVGSSMAAVAEGEVVVQTDVMLLSAAHHVEVPLSALSAASAGTGKGLKLQRRKRGRRCIVQLGQGRMW
jgi:hypothetical protein